MNSVGTMEDEYEESINRCYFYIEYSDVSWM